MVSLDQSVSVPADVLVRVVDGEAVLLNLDDESYYGLDDVSTDFWTAITETKTLKAAIERVQGEFDVDADTLFADFTAFVTELIEAGLLSLNESANA